MARDHGLRSAVLVLCGVSAPGALPFLARTGVLGVLLSVLLVGRMGVEYCGYDDIVVFFTLACLVVVADRALGERFGAGGLGGAPALGGGN